MNYTCLPVQVFPSVLENLTRQKKSKFILRDEMGKGQGLHFASISGTPSGERQLITFTVGVGLECRSQKVKC